MKALTSDLSEGSSRPYFLWDENTTVSEFRRALRDSPAQERWCLIARLMREARDPDVWRFVTPDKATDSFGVRLPIWTRRSKPCEPRRVSSAS